MDKSVIIYNDGILYLSSFQSFQKKKKMIVVIVSHTDQCIKYHEHNLCLFFFMYHDSHDYSVDFFLTFLFVVACSRTEIEVCKINK